MKLPPAILSVVLASIVAMNAWLVRNVYELRQDLVMVRVQFNSHVSAQEIYAFHQLTNAVPGFRR